MNALPMPVNLTAAAARDGRQDWLARLPDVVRRVAAAWHLELADPYQPGGMTAWVAPAADPAGRQLVLKVGWRHPEAEHEGLGLRAWAGHGTVLLHAEHQIGDTFALLVERCVPGDALAARPEPEQDAVIAGLLRRLWAAPAAERGFRPLTAMCEQWADEFERQQAAGQVALDPGLVRAGLSLFRELPRSAASQVLLCTDLHAANVLRAQREPWLVIDPKPHLGDPAYDPLQHMLNCDERLRAGPRSLAATMAGLLGLDAGRVLLWLFARCVIESPEWPQLADVARQIPPP
jgi:streptomycin 6-kinase